MELTKKNLHQICRKSEAETQITFDEDYNVPDTKPDVGRMIQKKGEVVLKEVQVSEGRARITGTLEFHLLYVSDGQVRRIYHMDGALNIDENINLDGLTSGDKICLKWDMEDLSIHLINSPKAEYSRPGDLSCLCGGDTGCSPAPGAEGFGGDFCKDGRSCCSGIGGT